MISFQSEKVVKTRKEHRCFTCLDKIPKNSDMLFISGKFDGQMYSMYLCECCTKFRQMNSEWFEDGIGQGEFKGEKDYEEFKKLYYGK